MERKLGLVRATAGRRAAHDVTGQLVSKEAFLSWPLHRSRKCLVGRPSSGHWTHARGKFAVALGMGRGERKIWFTVPGLQGRNMLIGQCRKGIWAVVACHQPVVFISRAPACLASSFFLPARIVPMDEVLDVTSLSAALWDSSDGSWPPEVRPAAGRSSGSSTCVVKIFNGPDM